MKRSEINAILADADDMMRRHGFVLPPFAYWTPEEFAANASNARHVIDARCEWDITDYGAGDFDKMGLFLFTLRNGLLSDLQAGGGMFGLLRQYHSQGCSPHIPQSHPHKTPPNRGAFYSFSPQMAP